MELERLKTEQAEIFNKISLQVKREPVQCSCSKCREQCKRTPCIGTPHDILRLIQEGYGNSLAYTEWAAGVLLGHISRPIPMVQIKEREDGSCVFFNDGKCELHDLGLKPTEGRLSSHKVYYRELFKEYNTTYQVAREWLLDSNLEVVNEIVEKLKELWKEKR